MRKSISYFVRKLEVMQKITTMWWISDRLRQQSKGPKKEYPRLYYRYESIEEIEEKIIDKQVLSGLTTMKDDISHFGGSYLVGIWKTRVKGEYSAVAAQLR